MEQNERLASDFYKNLTLNIKSPVWQKMGLDTTTFKTNQNICSQYGFH